MPSHKKTISVVANRGQMSLSSPSTVNNYFVSLWDRQTMCTYESLYVVYLDRMHRPIEYKLHATGNEHSVNFNSEDILRRAIELNAKNIVLAHNHPDGNPAPSDADIECTEEIYIKCKFLGINFNDHLIITPNRGFSSLSEMGYFKKFETNYGYLVNARKTGSYENVALTLLNMAFEQIGQKMIPDFVYRQLTKSLEKVYVKFFDPII